MRDYLTKDFVMHWEVSSRSLVGISTASLVAEDSPIIVGALERTPSAMGFSARSSECNWGLAEFFEIIEYIGALLVSILAESFTRDVCRISKTGW
jgi:hypothetical protein